MKTSVIIIILVAVVLSMVGIWYFLNISPESPTTNINQNLKNATMTNTNTAVNTNVKTNTNITVGNTISTTDLENVNIESGLSDESNLETDLEIPELDLEVSL